VKNRALVAGIAVVALLTALVVVVRPNMAEATASGGMPEVTTGSATGVSASSATLDGSVTPRRYVTTAYFQWGATSAYGARTSSRSIPAGSSMVPVSAALGGLTAGTIYHFRLVATNAKGTSFGGDQAFTTTAPTPTSSPTTTPTSTATSTPSPTTATSTTTSSPTSTTPSPTSTTPAPTSTTPSPTSTSTGTGCTNPYFTTSDPNGGITDGGYYVHNNLWNAGNYPGTTGATQVCSYHSWNHIAQATNTGDGAVKTYPNVHKDYSGRTIASFTTLTSTFAARSPGVGIYDVAYDLWLNGVPNDEVMIWTDNHNQYPAGSRFASNVALSGHTWDVYATSNNGYIAFVPSGGARLTSGTLDIKAMLGYLVSQGKTISSSTVDQICYGVEVVDTGGSPATWNFTDFSIADS
jgi:hypothetical protein